MVTNVRLPLITAGAVTGGAPNVREPLQFTGAVTGGNPNVRASLVLAQGVTGGNPNVRAPLLVAGAITGGQPAIRSPLIVVIAIVDVPEVYVATEVFPTLQGFTWGFTKNPEFNVVFRKNTTGKRTKNAFMKYPVWHFEAVFDFLRDDNLTVYDYSDLRTLIGFYARLQSTGDSFLFRDRDDYHVVGGTIGEGDGATAIFDFLRDFGGFSEPVGQIDLSQLVSFGFAAVNTGTDTINALGHGLTTGQGPLWIQNSGGALPTGLVAATPYWAIEVDVDNFKLASTLANALAGTAVDITAQGSGTDTVTKGVAIYDNGTLKGPTDWTLNLPNQAAFLYTPVAGHVLTADFDFWFVCDFADNQTDVSRFADRLWELQKLDFQSVV